MRGDDVRYRVGGDNAVLRLIIFQQWQERCYWCDEPKMYWDIQLDHIIAHTVSRQALDELIVQHGLDRDFDVHSAANLAPICGRCNREKSDRTFPGTLVSGKLAKAAAKRNVVEREVRRFTAANRAWMDAELLDLQLATPVERLERMRRLHERVQDPTMLWRIDHRTTPDGLTVIFTPRTPDAGPPPIFAFPANDPDAVLAQQALNEVVDYGGNIVIDGRYLVSSADNSPTWAYVLGATDPNAQVMVSTEAAPLDSAIMFHLTVVTQSGMVRNRLLLTAKSQLQGQRGVRIHLQDPASVFDAQLLIRRDVSRTTITGNLTMTPLFGRFPYEVRMAMDLFREAEFTDSLEFRLNDKLISGFVNIDPAALGQILTGFRHDAETIAALDRVQSFTGQRFPIPESITDAECDDIIKAARLLEGQTVRLPGITFTATILAGHVREFLELVHQQPEADLALHNVGYLIDCGQCRLDVGRIAMRLPRPIIANMDQVHAAIGTGTDVPVQFRAGDSGGAEIRLMEIDGQDLTLSR